MHTKLVDISFGCTLSVLLKFIHLVFTALNYVLKWNLPTVSSLCCLSVRPSCLGYPADPRHHPSLPECSCPTRPDVSLAPILWHLAGPRPTEQIWVSGAVQARPPTGPQATPREMVERGQGMCPVENLSHLQIFFTHHVMNTCAKRTL